ncbi:hypothetical protein VTO73DRAFT_10519 [Trametes versicolor]
MAPPSWTTAEQCEWLTALVPAFQEARVKGRQKNWRATLGHNWFLKWPEIKVLFGDVALSSLTPEQNAELVAAEIKRQKQLKRWFHNHASQSRTARAAAAPLPREITGLARTRRAPHAREVYIRMYYDDTKRGFVSAILEAARHDSGQRRVLSRAESMAITRKALDDMFEAEPDTVKEAVAARVVDETRLLAVPASLGQIKTPEDYQRAINAAPGWIERIMAPIAGVCGWCFTVVGAGPSPQDGGDITSFACHFGTTDAGHTFEQVSLNFKDQYVRPMVHFAKGVFSRDERARRALPVVYPDAAAEESEPTSADLPPGSAPTPPLAGSGNELPNASLTEATVITDPLLQGFQPNLAPAPLDGTTLLDFAGVGHSFPLLSDELDDGLLGLLGLDDTGTFNDAPFSFDQGAFLPGTGDALPQGIVPFDIEAGATGDTLPANPLPSGLDLLANLEAVARASVSAHTPRAPGTDTQAEGERPQRSRKAPRRYDEGAEPPSKRPKVNKAAAAAVDNAEAARTTRSTGARGGAAGKAAARGKAKANAAARATAASKAGETPAELNKTKTGTGRGGAKAGAGRGGAKTGAGRGGAKTGAGRGVVKRR